MKLVRKFLESQREKERDLGGWDPDLDGNVGKLEWSGGGHWSSQVERGGEDEEWLKSAKGWL